MAKTNLGLAIFLFFICSAISSCFVFKKRAAGNTIFSIAVEGDSMSSEIRNQHGQVATTSSSWAGHLKKKFKQPDSVSILNFSTAGESVLNMMSMNQINQVASSIISSRKLLFLFAGINDIHMGTSGEETYTRIKKLHLTYREKGFKTIGFTILASRHLKWKAEQTERFWTEITSCNKLMRDNYKEFCDVLVDTQSDPLFKGYDAPLNSSHFNEDRIHFNSTGSERFSRLAFKAYKQIEKSNSGVLVYGKRKLIKH